MAAPDIKYAPDLSGSGYVVTINDPAASSVDRAILYTLMNNDNSAATDEMQATLEGIEAGINTSNGLLEDIKDNTTPVEP